MFSSCSKEQNYRKKVKEDIYEPNDFLDIHIPSTSHNHIEYNAYEDIPYSFQLEPNIRDIYEYLFLMHKILPSLLMLNCNLTSYAT